MVDEIGKKGTTLDVLRSKENVESQISKGEKRQDVVQKEDFLNILVTQLKNQDPLNPMSNDQFAVDLAQFSQLEQLINLNEKFDGSLGSGDVAGLAQYLGHEISYKSEQINLGRQGSDILEVELGADSNVTLEILDANKEVVKTVELGNHPKGRVEFDLSDQTGLNGSYGFRVKAQAGLEEAIEAPSYLVGQVTGFIPGPDGSLFVGDKKVSASEVAMVRVKG